MSELKQVSQRVVGKIDLEFRKNAVRLITEEGYTYTAATRAMGVSSRNCERGSAGRLRQRNLAKYARPDRRGVLFFFSTSPKEDPAVCIAHGRRSE